MPAETVQEWNERRFFAQVYQTRLNDPVVRGEVEATFASLSPEAFTSAVNQALFAACKACIAEGVWPDPLEAFERAKAGTPVPWDYAWRVMTSDYDHGFRDHAGQLLNFGSCVKWLVTAAERRLKSDALARAQVAVMDGRDDDAAKLFEELERVVMAPDESPASMAHLLHAALSEDLAKLDKATAPRSVGTGISLLDRDMGPLDLGDMIVIGGGPSDGKSALALHILQMIAAADHIGKRAAPAGLVSLEDALNKTTDRFAAKIAGVRLRTDQPALTGPERATVDGLASLPFTSRIFLKKPSRARPAVLQAMAELARLGCEVVIVDYLQAVMTPGDKRSEYERFSETTLVLKEQARRLGVVLILLSQLNREGRKDGQAPRLGAQRGSGQIEENAENIVNLWRENPEDENSRRFAILAKAKSGPAGRTYEVLWDQKRACVTDFQRVTVPVNQPSNRPQGRNDFRDYR